jgi:hypothetical protein
VFQAADATRPEIAWESFFVVAAASNEQPPARLLDAFHLAWKSNAGRSDRWKLLAKMEERDFILDGNVVHSVLKSRVPKEWEVFLGFAVAPHRRESFREMWHEASGPASGPDFLEESSDLPEWRQARHLLGLVLADRDYIGGDVV